MKITEAQAQTALDTFKDKMWRDGEIPAMQAALTAALQSAADTPAPQPNTHGETYADKHGELRRLREVRGLGTRAMAAEIGISPATLNRAENGEMVSVEVAAKLGPFIGKCLCCDQPVGAPPQSRTVGTHPGSPSKVREE